jgi:GNAT superfamily N-acetyltransferase
VKLSGGCHCGSLRFTLFVPASLSALAALAALAPRACQCTFCRKHGARTVSDPTARARVIVRHPDALVRYRFARRATDSLLCGRCGVYLGGYLEESPQAWITLNANAFDDLSVFSAGATPVSYDEETDEARLARRRARWTPADLVTIAPEPADAPDSQALLAAYFEELRLVLPGFDPALSVSAAPEEMTPPRGRFLVARRSGRPLACGGVKTFASGVGEIKRMYIAPDARGLGLGRDLLDALESEARLLDLTRLVLDTAGPLSAAARLYRAAGYAEVPAYNDNPFASLWFAKSLR